MKTYKIFKTKSGVAFDSLIIKTDELVMDMSRLIVYWYGDKECAKLTLTFTKRFDGIELEVRKNGRELMTLQALLLSE